LPARIDNNGMTGMEAFQKFTAPNLNESF